MPTVPTMLLHSATTKSCYRCPSYFNEQLNKVYRKLSDHLEQLEDVIYLGHLGEGQVVAIILQEDLEDLVAECETYLIEETEIDKAIFTSIESRGSTVIDELRDLLARPCEERG